MSASTHYPYKNLSTAIVLAVFFGPVGLLYSSFFGGVFMIVIGIIVISCGYPFPIILTWLACAIWTARACEKYNRKIVEQYRLGVSV